MRKIIIITSLIMAFLPLSVSAQKGLSLSEAITIGLENNFDIKLTKSAVEIAQEQNTWGMAGGMPSISINGNLGAQGDLAITNEIVASGGASADLQWVLFNGFKVRATKALFENDEEYAEGNAMITLENTIHSIITSYYYVLLQQEMLTVNETVVKISKDQLDQQAMSKDIGASGTYEYIQAENAYLADKSSMLKQQVTLRDALRSLNLMLALPAETEWTLTESIDAPMSDYNLETMINKLMSDNRTLKNQYVSLKARDHEITQSRSALFPTIGFNASMGAGSRAFGVDNQSYITPQVGITLSFNLFNGGKTRRSINIAQINKEMETVSTQQMELSLKSELTSQMDGYNTYRQIVTLDNEQLKVSETLMKLSEERYKNGTIDSFNFLVTLDNEQLKVSETLMKLSEERYKNGTIDSFNFRDVQLMYLQTATNRLNSIYNLVVVNSQLLRLTGGIVDFVK